MATDGYTLVSMHKNTNNSGKQSVVSWLYRDVITDFDRKCGFLSETLSYKLQTQTLVFTINLRVNMLQRTLFCLQFYVIGI